jgi:hypothetical protein
MARGFLLLEEEGCVDGVGCVADCAPVVVVVVVEVLLELALPLSLKPVLNVSLVLSAVIVEVAVLDCCGALVPSTAGEGTSLVVDCLGDDMRLAVNTKHTSMSKRVGGMKKSRESKELIRK